MDRKGSAGNGSNGTEERLPRSPRPLPPPPPVSSVARGIMGFSLHPNRGGRWGRRPSTSRTVSHLFHDESNACSIENM